ncbi:ThuA domain-containing protein [Rhodoflexus sp.]
MKTKLLTTIFILLLLAVADSCYMRSKDPVRILVFSKTAGFRHSSIPNGIAALRKIAEQNGYLMDTTENAANFNEDNLKKYAAVVFLSTTGDVLNEVQQADFERYIQAGGGYVGIHAAADTEYDWPWYGQLVGGYFNGHPSTPSNVQRGQIFVVDKNHPSTEHLPDTLERTDEWYDYRDMYPGVRILMRINEKSYIGSNMTDHHAIAWYHEFDGGRAWYTAGGHTEESFSEPDFLRHISGGLRYAIGNAAPLDYQKAKSKRVPEENRFTKVVLDSYLDEPTELTVLPDGRVLFLERKGKIKIYRPDENKVKEANQFKVNTTHEDGLLGLAADPDFAQNKWIYLYYSHPVASVNQLSRFTMKGDSLDPSTEVQILTVPVQRQECCHTGGSIAFDGQGNLFLSTGDNTNPFASDGYSPSDERPDRSPWDAQRSSANTNDLRGKILRIKPQADGSYTIPEGNLFPKGTPNTRPEIYVMGCRNPYRISVDKKTGYLYWGDVGPDAGEDSPERGPKGYCEINQAKAPGNFGWPHFVADNKAYQRYDFETKQPLGFFNPEKPMNLSPNNTGRKELPPAQKAMIWYPYGESKEFPIVGTGGRNPMAGEVFHADRYRKSDIGFPDYFDGKLFIYEWMRGWLMTVSFDEQGQMKNLSRFMPNTVFNNPMDMEFAPDGSLYMLEYGTNWFSRNADARLVRIEYSAGNRRPVVKLNADKVVGATPLKVQFDTKGTVDFDGDPLRYEWFFTADAKKPQATTAAPSFIFVKPGIYQVRLKVSDGKGGTAQQTIEIRAGNAPPEVSLTVSGNQTFYFDNEQRNYTVSVRDKEDGTVESGGIDPEEVIVRMDYLSEGKDLTIIAQGHQVNSSEITGFLAGKRLIDDSDCRACHALQQKSVGPSYTDIAKRYHQTHNAVAYLAEKIIKGGAGVWGDKGMAAHPQISLEQASEMARYILSLAEDKKAGTLPMKGNFIADRHIGKNEKGIYVLRAAYTDKGGNGVGAITNTSTLVLRPPTLKAVDANAPANLMKVNFNGKDYAIMGDNTFAAFKNIDLTGIASITLGAATQGTSAVIEIRLGAPDGKLIGQASIAGEPVFQMPKIAIPPQQGKHDLFFVSRIKEVKAQPMVALEWLLFGQE